jgi:hypothetical protein
MTDYRSFVYSGFASSGVSGDACKNRGNWSLVRSAEVVDDQPEKEKWDVNMIRTETAFLLHPCFVDGDDFDQGLQPEGDG